MRFLLLGIGMVAIGVLTIVFGIRKKADVLLKSLEE